MTLSNAALWRIDSTYPLGLGFPAHAQKQQQRFRDQTNFLA